MWPLNGPGASFRVSTPSRSSSMDSLLEKGNAIHGMRFPECLRPIPRIGDALQNSACLLAELGQHFSRLPSPPPDDSGCTLTTAGPQRGAAPIVARQRI